MRITAVYDADGVILAAVVDTGQDDHPVPVASEGTEVGTFDVPRHAAGSRLDEICTSYRVDPGSRSLRAAPPQE
ncbi:hypothetical protein [Micromonospora echinofusca]|uniref:DUF2283 domain-containing protein n=1 Tax=Micromonospora echinofusca TaxID=47858 RepID=A0ABS3VZM4_MICEH|nr:hypothetical protein [Micromonospora echinofusca]MBO4209990.1 hypothetical protein [Micromonospora echinofusca]